MAVSSDVVVALKKAAELCVQIHSTGLLVVMEKAFNVGPDDGNRRVGLDDDVKDL